ncbi:MAG: MBOAT family O-acyltransferase [Clostridia bacterium]|nr:MBOAT family O-acyltransferase [Clostridia bacterium]
MVFSSMTFLCCALPAALAVYYIIPKSLRNIWLLIFSLLFYAWGEPVYVVIMLFSISVNWLAGIALGSVSQAGGRRAVLIAALFVNLGLLMFFKYAGFFITTVNTIAGSNIRFIRPVLPIGISFYTFQALSYVIDVYRGDTPHQRSWPKLALYVSLFPQLIAGPILRYRDVERQIDERRENISGVFSGLSRFTVGLAKKVLIANAVAPLADEAFSVVAPSMPGAWLGVIAYSLQIYFDFSGYSDMAIGLGAMFGFSYPENFRYPYIARSIREFWNRWHISLSSWFRDYLYFPLGGNRKGKARQALNLLCVFLATGLWHGAGWTFIAWGLYYAVARAIEALFTGGSATDCMLKKAFNWMYTAAVVLVGWVLFRADSLPHAASFLMAMASGNPGMLTRATPLALTAVATGLIAATPLPLCMFERLSHSAKTVCKALLTPAVLILCMLYLASGAYNPFIYFRF